MKKKIEILSQMSPTIKREFEEALRVDGIIYDENKVPQLSLGLMIKWKISFPVEREVRSPQRSLKWFIQELDDDNHFA
jgi:hypothetical protein